MDPSEIQPTQTLPIEQSPAPKKNSGLKYLALSLMVVLAIGAFFAGRRYYQQQRPQVAQPSNSSTPTSLTIKELGIKFDLPSDLNGLYYVLSNSYVDQNFDQKPINKVLTYAGLGLKSIDHIADCNAEKTGGAPLGSILVTDLSPSLAGDGGDSTLGGSFIKKVGEYYLYFRTPQSSCADNNNDASAQIKLINEIPKALQSARSISKTNPSPTLSLITFTHKADSVSPGYSYQYPEVDVAKSENKLNALPGYSSEVIQFSDQSSTKWLTQSVTVKDGDQIPDGDHLIPNKSFLTQLASIDKYKSGNITSALDKKSYTFERQGDFAMLGVDVEAQLYTSSYTSQNLKHSEYVVFHTGGYTYLIASEWGDYKFEYEHNIPIDTFKLSPK